jgi:GntR family transcriptional regulator
LKQSISFQLNRNSGVPPYLQLVKQIKQALRMGIIDAGDQLPTVKEVVAEIGINPNTVTKAYRELESEGFVEGRVGVGTFVIKRPDGPPPKIHARLAISLAEWVQGAKEQGLDEEAIEAMLRATLRIKSQDVA